MARIGMDNLMILDGQISWLIIKDVEQTTEYNCG
jgi:hypothetical protein